MGMTTYLTMSFMSFGNEFSCSVKHVASSRVAAVPLEELKYRMHAFSVTILKAIHSLPSDHSIFSYNWMPSGGGQVPPNAVQGGMTEMMEPLYIARGMVNGEWCVGKVHPSHGVAYFPYNGGEHALNQYEVLCYMKF